MPLNDFEDYSPAGAGGGSAPGASPGGAGTASDAPRPDDPGSPSGGADDGSGGGGSAENGSGGSESNGSGSNGSGSNGSGSGNGSSPSPDAGEPPPDAAPTAPSACGAVELEGPDESCFFLDATTRTFFGARNACQARGSGWDLASVRSAETSAFLGAALGFEGWLVGSDVANEGNWVWLDDGAAFWQGGSAGAPVGAAYANWNATEPNGGNTTNCMRALPRSAGSANPDAPWADLACSAVRGGICRGPQQ